MLNFPCCLCRHMWPLHLLSVLAATACARLNDRVGSGCAEAAITMVTPAVRDYVGSGYVASAAS